MAIAKLEKEQVTGALKATGSSDADILFARKEELLTATRKMDRFAVVPIAAGAAMCLTILGAIAGIPAILYGVRLRKQIRSNIDIAESAYSEYVTALSTRPRAAISTKGSPMHKPTLFVSLALIALSLHAQQPAATPSVCATQRFCAEVNSFAATITDFRTSNVGRYKVVTAAIRFQNKLTRPVVLGYVNGSGVTTDDQGNRYAVSGADGVRGIGLISNNQVDPKFSLQPGASGDTRIEMVWGWSGREVFGLNFEMEFTVREMGQLPSGQFRLGPEHPLRFRGLANNILSTAPAAPQGSAAPLSESLGDGPVLPAVTPAPSGGATPSGPVPAQAAPQGPDLCIGVRNCFNAGSFAADVQNISSSVYGGRHHILRYNVRIRNASAQQLILAYTNGSLVTVDNLGQRYGATSGPTAGIGTVTGRSADPQFVLNPGQSKMVSFEVMRRNSGQPTGTSYTFDVSLEQLEILPSQQVRSVRQFSLNFPNLTLSAMPGGAPGANAQGLADTSKKIVDIFKKK